MTRRKSTGKCYGCGVKFEIYQSTWITCNDCDRSARERKIERQRAKEQARIEKEYEAKFKVCPKCNEKKLKRYFYQYPNRVSSYCKKCIKK